jgi:cyanophycin synthetase
MRVLARAVYRGPHLYSRTPMIRIQLDLGPLEQRPTDTLPEFVEALVETLPELRQHGCSYREPGGFLRRLTDGTWMGHVVEHVALALQTAAGATGAVRGKTRSVKTKPGVYNVMYAYDQEEPGLIAGRLSLELVDDLLPPDLRGLRGLDRVHAPVLDPAEPLDVQAAVAAVRRSLGRTRLGPTTRSLVREAERRGIPVMRLDEQSLVQLGWGSRRKLLRASITGETSQIAVESAGNKQLTRTLLAGAGVPVPQGEVVRTVRGAVEAAARLGWPVVVKPLDGNHGRGVTLDIVTEDGVRDAFARAAEHGRRIIVEQQLTGRDHRILVVNGRVVAVAERVPAHVVGDGASTVGQLIETVNRDPRRGVGHEQVMTRISVDEHVIGLLRRAGLTLESVPARGVTVFLRDTANLSTGGTAVDRTDDIHPDNAAIARRAVLTLGLDVAGVDFLATDITRSVRETGGGIVEVNAAPGFRMHLEPSVGQARDVARPVIDMLFPRGSRSRIPIVAITGTNGKSTTARMVGRVLRQAGMTVGLTSTSGVYVNDERVLKADASGPKSARMVLRDPTVDAAVLEVARGGLLREGLAFDVCDVGMVLNVQADHLGLGGIDTLEELARVKSVVTASTARRGTSVLNADDPLTIRMARHARGRLCWFSLRGGDDMPGFLRRHVAEGGRAVVLEPGERGGRLVVHDRGERVEVVDAAAIPLTMGGLAGFNTQNALAALAAGVSLGVSPAVAAEGLAALHSTFEENPGRLNIHDIAHGSGRVRVIMDYAHNPAGLTALKAYLDQVRGDHDRLIGLVSIPGDRRDADIREMGEIAAGVFDRLVFRERPDGRGRRPGEVVRLLTEGALAAGFPEARLLTVLSEGAAVEAALRLAEPGDLVVLLPTELDPVWKQVTAFQPQPAAPDPAARSEAGEALHA